MADTTQFLVKPRFSALRNAIYFPTGSLNTFQAAEYNDKFGFYQRTFGVYSYMPLTQDLTYKIHYAQGTPLIWQTHNSCAWTPTGTLSMGETEITPQKAKINEQLCYDEYFNSTYKAWLQWGQNPNVGMNAAGVNATNELTRAIVKNATMGARVSMIGGQLYDIADVTIVDDTPTRIEQAFEKTIGTIKGWIELLKTKATEDGMGHLNDSSLITAANISTDGTTYTGATKTVVELYDENLAIAKDPLYGAIVEGGVGGFGFDFYPLWLVSPSIHRALDLEWKTLKESATINEPRIRREPFTVQTSLGQRTVYVFMIDDTVVIPISEMSVYDQFITGTSHFCFLTISGVIQMGSSFGNIPVVNENEVAIMVQQSQDAEDLGMYKFLAHSLMGTAVNDTRYIAGGYSFAEPS